MGLAGTKLGSGPGAGRARPWGHRGPWGHRCHNYTARTLPGVLRRPVHPKWASDALGVAWTVLAAVVVMAPALRPGISFGPFDLLSRIGLTRGAGTVAHGVFPSDQILQFAPWTDLAWTQVHQGHVPLWNPYNVLGVPLAFNWQSGVFSLPALVGYILPVRYAYTALVLVKLVVAGTGAYALCRVVGITALGAAFGGTAFELSGPLLDHIGWANTGVMCWAGWIFAAALALMKGGHRLRWTILLALGVAWAIYAGHPESLFVLGLMFIVFVAVYLWTGARTARHPVARPVRDVVIAGGCGAGLGAALLLPGVQLLEASSHRYSAGTPAFALSNLPNVVAAGLQGTNLKSSAYVGVAAVVLAVVATRISWRRPEIAALAAVAVVGVLLSFVSPVDDVLGILPGGHTLTWTRAVMVLALALAVLAAYGIDIVARSEHRHAAMRSGVGALAVVVVVLLAVAVTTHHDTSLLWPAAEVVVVLVLGALWWRSPPGRPEGVFTVGRCAAPALLVVSSAFLVATGVGSWSLSSSYFSPTPAVTVLQRTVGQSTVGISACRVLPFTAPYSTETGIRPNANIGYGVHEFAVYDATVPESYFTLWSNLGGQHIPSGLHRIGVFCPQITTATQARVFGVGFVLEPRHARGPTGAVFDRMVGTEQLFRIPGAAPATLISTTGGEALSIDTPGTPVAVTHPEPSTWRLHVEGSGPALLRLRLTDVPGWHATIDGKPLSLEPWAQATMLEAKVPAGSHVVELHYWPDLFSVGIVIAVVVAVGLAAAGGIVAVRTRRGRRRVGVASSGVAL